MTLINNSLFLIGLLLFKGAFVLGLGAVTVRCLRQQSAGVRHWIWVLTFVCILLLPVGLLFPTLNLPILPANPLPASELASTEAAESVSEVIATIPSPSFPWRIVPIAVWLLGILYCWFGLIRRAKKVHRHRDDSILVEDIEWQNLLSELCDSIGLRRPVRLIRWNENGIPMTWGVRKPVVLLPAVSVEWDESKLRMVLLHELAHIQRRDILTQRIAQYVCMMHWCNPFMWRALDTLLIEGEHACDDVVLSLGIKPATYAEFLFKLAKRIFSLPTHARYAVTMANQSELKARVTALLSTSRNRTSITRAGILGACTLFVLLFSLIAPLHLSDGPDAYAGTSVAESGFLPVSDNSGDDPGRLRGKIIDADTGESIPMANIQLVGTRLGAATDLDGHYIINDIAPGMYAVRASFAGMHVTIQEGVIVESGITTELDFALTRQSTSIDPSSPEAVERIRIGRRIDSIRVRLGRQILGQQIEESPPPGSTGKITGRITDAVSGEPLPGVNILIMGTQIGAASDIEGNFFIPNVLPGHYALRASFIGFERMELTDVTVTVGSTTTINFALNRDK